MYCLRCVSARNAEEDGSTGVQGIAYRDIKPENVLLDNSMDIKLCDFGFARVMPENPANETVTDYVATRWYRAPELLLGPNYTTATGARMRARYGRAVDFWAIGCLMVRVCTGHAAVPRRIVIACKRACLHM